MTRPYFGEEAEAAERAQRAQRGFNVATDVLTTATDYLKAERAEPGATQRSAGEVLDSGGSGLQDTASDAASRLTKGAVSLPKLQVRRQPGPWADPGKWETPELRALWGRAKKFAVAVTLQPRKFTSSVEAALSALAGAKADLDAVKPKADAALEGSALRADYNRLAKRWYEAASGVLRNAVYVEGGGPVESLGANDKGLALHVLSVKGMRFTAPAVAFAEKGGAAYARLLSRDTATLRAMAEGRAAPAAPSAPGSGSMTPDARGGSLGLAFLAVLGGGLWLGRKKIVSWFARRRNSA